MFIETECVMHTGLARRRILTLEPECLKEPDQHPIGGNTQDGNESTRDTQAACVFRCSASKSTPFFQTIKVMAAILRATVRRAIEGFTPLVIKVWQNSFKGPVQLLALVAAPLKMFLRSLLRFLLSPRSSTGFLERRK